MNNFTPTDRLGGIDQWPASLHGWIQAVVDTGHELEKSIAWEKCDLHIYQNREKGKIVVLIVWPDGTWHAFYPKTGGKGNEVEIY